MSIYYKDKRIAGTGIGSINLTPLNRYGKKIASFRTIDGSIDYLYSYSGTSGGVIDGILCKVAVLHTPATNTNVDTYTVENDCLLSITYTESVGNAVITIKVNENIVERAQITDNTDVEFFSRAIPVASGSIIKVERTNGGLLPANFTTNIKITYAEYKLNSLAPQIAMPEWDENKKTEVINGWEAIDNGWLKCRNNDDQINNYVSINGIVVWKGSDTIHSPSYDVGVVPVSKGDIVTFGLASVIFYPCKTVQQVNPPVWLDKTGKDANSDNNWWRLYSDNFIEQGGTAASDSLNVILPQQMKDTNYQIYSNGVGVSNKTSIGFTLASACDWLVKGFIK